MVKLTYETAVQWGIDNVPMSLYDSFEDWYSACETEFGAKSKLFDNDKFRDMMFSAWSDEMDEDEDIPERESRFEIPSLPRKERPQTEKMDTERKPATERTPEPLPFNKQVEQQHQPVFETKQPIVIQSSTIQSQRILPPTGKAPELPKPVFKQSLGERARGFFRRFRR